MSSFKVNSEEQMLLNEFTPPIVKKVIKKMLYSPKIYPTYGSAQNSIAQTGYDSQLLMTFTFNKTKEFISELNSKVHLSLEEHHIFLLNVIGSIITKSKKDNIAILDFGGAFGTHYFIVKKFFPQLSFEWKVVELPQVAEQAKALENSELTFIHSNNDFTDTLGKFDLVLTAGTLQHVSDPEKMLSFLCKHEAPYLALLRLGVNLTPNHIWTIHKAPLRDFGPGKSPKDCPHHIFAFPFCLLSELKLTSLLSKYTLILSSKDNSGVIPLQNYQTEGFNRLYSLQKM